MAYLNNEVAKNSHVLLLVSMQELNQTGRLFEENVNLLLENDNIEEVSLLLSDELHRHNLMVQNKLEEAEATLDARKMTSQWLAANEMALNALKQKGGTVYLFGDFLQEKAFQHCKQLVLSLYDTERSFASNVMTVANIFCQKHLQSLLRNSHCDDEEPKQKDIKEHMKNFLIEESAMVIYLGTREDLGKNKNKVIDYRAYAGKTPSPMKKAYEALGQYGRMKQLMILPGEKKKRQKEENKANADLFSNGTSISVARYNAFFHHPFSENMLIADAFASYQFTMMTLFKAQTKELDPKSQIEILSSFFDDMLINFSTQLPRLKKQFEKNKRGLGESQQTILIDNDECQSYASNFNGSGNSL